MSNHRKWLAAMAIVLCALGFVLYEFITAATQNVDLVRSMMKESDYSVSKHVILISQERNTPYWQTLEQGAAKTASELNIGMEYWAPYRLNPEEQQNLLAKAIAARPDAILLQGLKTGEYDSLIREAGEAGIAVVAVDSDAPASGRLAYVGTDNLAAGKLLGELVVQAGGAPRSIGIIIGSSQADNQQLRLQGFKSVIEAADGYTITAMGESNISRIEAARQTADLLAKHPGIDTMVGLSGLDAPGIAEGLKVAGRTDVRVYGFDDLDATRAGIAEGTIVSTVVQQPAAIGEEAVRLLNRYFQRQKVPDISYTAITILDKTGQRESGAQGASLP